MDGRYRKFEKGPPNSDGIIPWFLVTFRKLKGVPECSLNLLPNLGTISYLDLRNFTFSQKITDTPSVVAQELVSPFHSV